MKPGGVLLLRSQAELPGEARRSLLLLLRGLHRAASGGDEAR